MTAWPEHIEALRTWVLWECRDIPPDLVLAVIQNESNGAPGIQGRGKTRAGKLPDVNGNFVELCHAMGLMQTIPATVIWYNETADDPATVDDMEGEDERAARLQIRVGCRYLAFVNHYLHKKNASACPAASLADANDDQIKFVLCGYAVGHGAITEKLSELQRQKIPATWSNIKKYYPTWGQKNGKWINRPVQYAERVFDNYRAHKQGSYEIPVPTPLGARIAGKLTSSRGILAAVLILGGAGYLIDKYYTRMV